MSCFLLDYFFMSYCKIGKANVLSQTGEKRPVQSERKAEGLQLQGLPMWRRKKILIKCNRDFPITSFFPITTNTTMLYSHSQQPQATSFDLTTLNLTGVQARRVRQVMAARGRGGSGRRRDQRNKAEVTPTVVIP